MPNHKESEPPSPIIIVVQVQWALVDANTVVLGHPVWKVALAIHITSWILQFIGHGVFEGKLRACYIPQSLGIW